MTKRHQELKEIMKELSEVNWLLAKDEYIGKLETELAELRARKRQKYQSGFKPNAGGTRKTDAGSPTGDAAAWSGNPA